MCLETGAATIGVKLGEGEFINHSNNDLSMNQIHGAIGQKTALEGMSEFSDILNRADMIEVPNDED